MFRFGRNELECEWVYGLVGFEVRHWLYVEGCWCCDWARLAGESGGGYMPVNRHCHGLGMSFRLYGSCSRSCWTSGLRRFVHLLVHRYPGWWFESSGNDVPRHGFPRFPESRSYYTDSFSMTRLPVHSFTTSGGPRASGL